MKPMLKSCSALMLLAPVAVAQERIWYANGEDDLDQLGNVIEILPDLDGDGSPELIVGAWGHHCVPGSSPADGIAYEFSATGAQLNEWCGEEEGLPTSVTTLQDVDGDGVRDFVLGGPFYEDPKLGPSSGRVHVYSARTGAQILELKGDMPDISFGKALAGLPDLDGDGYPELLVGSSGYSSGRGKVWVISTKDGSTLRTHVGPHSFSQYGRVVAALGDVDADGTDDYVVHADLSFQKGRIYVYSGATGAELWRVTGFYDTDFLGISISDGGDIDGDGYADLIAGGLAGSTNGGHLDGYSGKTGKLLFRIDAVEAFELFGWSCDMVGDANADGVGDYLVGARDNSHDGRAAGRATLYSGSTLRPIYTFYPGYNQAGFGLAVRGGADFNGDGINDFIISSPYDNPWRHPGGRVSIFADNDLYLQADDTNPLPGAFVTFDTRGGIPGSFAELVLVDVNGTSVFAPLDYGFLDANGELASTLCVPDDATGLDFTVISYAVKLTHRPKWNDSSPVVISVQ